MFLKRKVLSDFPLRSAVTEISSSQWQPIRYEEVGGAPHSASLIGGRYRLSQLFRYLENGDSERKMTEDFAFQNFTDSRLPVTGMRYLKWAVNRRPNSRDSGTRGISLQDSALSVKQNDVKKRWNYVYPWRPAREKKKNTNEHDLRASCAKYTVHAYRLAMNTWLVNWKLQRRMTGHRYDLDISRFRSCFMLLR